MGRTLTNNFSLAYAIQDSFGVLGATPAWKLLELNSIDQFGPEITTVPRDPISPNRQRRKGTITDLDSSVEFETDLTLDAFRDFVEGFLFSLATNDRLQSGALFQTLVADDALPTLLGEGWEHDALAAAIPVGQLVFARGFSNSLTNGLHEVGQSSTTETEVVGTPGITAEDPGNAGGATLETAGFRFTDLVMGRHRQDADFRDGGPERDRPDPGAADLHRRPDRRPSASRTAPPSPG